MKSQMLYWIFWISFIHSLTSFSVQLVSSVCLDDQRSLLLELKNGLQYSISESIKLSTWNQNSDCCSWNGVQCNSSTGHVIGLDLSGESISENIDGFRSLFRLQSLQSLNLANNRYNGTEFPTGFGKLTGLTYLNLSKAGFSGQIPIDISQLVNLVTLDLDLSSISYLFELNPLKLENPSFGEIIRNMTNLKGLHLNGVVISASGAEWCKALSTSVPNLQFLSLSGCNLSGGIDPSLEKLHSLSEINIDQNNLADVVPDFMANFRNLTLLHLSNCQLNGIFPRKVLQLPTLRSLDLSYNSFLQGTLPEFPVGALLQELFLSLTSFSGKLPESVGNLLQLRTIDLQNCSFNGSIPSSLGKIDQLEYVDLSFNTFSSQIPSFSSAKNLIRLHLNNNVLTGTLASTNWSKLSKLIDIGVSTNLLQGSIPVEMFSSPCLQILQLFQNRFNGILQELTNMPSLNTLDLSNNNFQGSLPKSLFRLKALKILKLSSNNFIGTLNLNEIQLLQNLSTLDLSFNSLSIEASDTVANVSLFPQLSSLRLASCNLRVLPNFLKNQSILQELDLSINSIRGVMPKWIWGVGNGHLSYLNLSCNSFTRLEQPFSDISRIIILDIHSNKIQGEIPSPTSPRMMYMDYSNNNFSSVSPTIGNSIPYAAYLSLSGNNISHEIPTTLCNLTNLQVLDLSLNSLTGKIPECVIKMSSTLNVLNLRENNFNSTLFDEFPRGCSLSTLNIGDNSLQGQIPRSLANCKQLEVLDIRKNRFTGTFPDSLRNLSSLRVMVLRANNFYGSLSCPGKHISWPLLQIMDLSFNHFDGELKAQCFSKFKTLMTIEPTSATTQLRVAIFPLNEVYYQDMVVVTPKGKEIPLQKILTVYKGIDISSNEFHGAIPTTIGDLVTLIFLNMSNNALSGPIPSSIGNMMMLESLDLSHNGLSGRIPTQIAKLNFLSLLNLSYNNLSGTIPQGNQLQTFDSNTYIGNPGLRGPPLKPNCQSAPSNIALEQARVASNESEIEWLYILVGVGFFTGVTSVTASLIFWQKGWMWHDKQVAKLVSAIRSAG